MYCPPDRNQVEMEIQGGINFAGMWDLRPDDIFGVAASFTKLSPSVQKLDRATAVVSEPLLPIRNYELQLELDYQMHIVPGLILQPSFQFIHFPGAGAANPLGVGLGRIQDAAVLGLRFGAKF
jgi:porin